MKMDSKAQNVTDYIAAAPQQVQPMLNQIRAAIQQVAPNATEYISYGMPVFKYEKPFIGFAAMKNHIGFYPMSGSFVAAHKKELAGYTTSKGAIQLPLDKPLPPNPHQESRQTEDQRNEREIDCLNVTLAVFSLSRELCRGS